MINVGVIGYGYWGPNLVRNFHETPGSQVKAVCDLDPRRLSLAQKRYPSLFTSTDHRELLKNPAIDVIAIATPVAAHYPLALEALKAGKHILLEKPMTQSSEQALRLMEEAAKRNLTLMVDHTFVYTSAVRKIKELVAGGSLGEIYYYDSTRINLGLFQSDVNVIWDLAAHDVSILHYLFENLPCAISATGINHIPGSPENMAFLTIFFESNLIAHIHVNWLAPVKVRRTLLGASRKMVIYDDLEMSEKIKIYDKGITVNDNGESIHQLLIGYRSGDMWAPNLPVTEALRTEAEHLVYCLEHGERPQTDGEAGFRVVQILEAATRSVRLQGQPVELDPKRKAA
jgi:predicted dehydrogenase